MITQKTINYLRTLGKQSVRLSRLYGELSGKQASRRDVTNYLFDCLKKQIHHLDISEDIKNTLIDENVTVGIISLSENSIEVFFDSMEFCKKVLGTHSPLMFKLVLDQVSISEDITVLELEDVDASSAPEDNAVKLDLDFNSNENNHAVVVDVDDNNKHTDDFMPSNVPEVAVVDAIAALNDWATAVSQEQMKPTLHEWIMSNSKLVSYDLFKDIETEMHRVFSQASVSQENYRTLLNQILNSRAYEVLQREFTRSISKTQEIITMRYVAIFEESLEPFFITVPLVATDIDPN